MKTARFILLNLVLGLFLSSCAVPAYQWRVTDNGAKVWWTAKAKADNRLNWIGDKTPTGEANGPGRLIEFQPRFEDLFTLYPEYTLTHQGSMESGKFAGEVIAESTYNGSIAQHTYVAGESVGYRMLKEPRKSVAASDGNGGNGDEILIGAMFGLAGIAGGDATVAGAGAQMMAGDGVGAANALMQAGGARGNGGGGTVGGSKPQVSANQPNLIDKYGLAKYRGSAGDHIVYYIQAADQAYSSYQQSGEAAYYAQHREYSDLAKHFHARTSS